MPIKLIRLQGPAPIQTLLQGVLTNSHDLQQKCDFSRPAAPRQTPGADVRYSVHCPRVSAMSVTLRLRLGLPLLCTDPPEQLKAALQVTHTHTHTGTQGDGRRVILGCQPDEGGPGSWWQLSIAPTWQDDDHRKAALHAGGGPQCCFKRVLAMAARCRQSKQSDSSRFHQT